MSQSEGNNLEVNSGLGAVNNTLEQSPGVNSVGTSGSGRTSVEGGNQGAPVSNESLNPFNLTGGDTLISQHRINLLDSISLVPIFTGDDPLCSFAHFKEKFDQCALFFKWSEEVQYFAVQQRLTGRAHQTFSNFRSQISKVEDIFNVLKDRFSPVRHPSEVLADFWEFKHPPTMPVAEYVAQARQKVRAATVAQNFPVHIRKDMEEKWLLAMLLKNLDSTIRRGVIARNPTTLAELEIFATNEEKAILATQNAQPTGLNPFANEFVAAAVDVNRPQKHNSELEELRDLVKNLKVQLDSVAGTVADFVSRQGPSGANSGYPGHGFSGGNDLNTFSGASGVNNMQYNNGVNNFQGVYRGDNIQSPNNNFNGGNFSQQIICHHCHQPGHTKRYCRQLQAQQQTQSSGFSSHNRGNFRENGNNTSNRGRGRNFNSNVSQNSGRGSISNNPNTNNGTSYANSNNAIVGLPQSGERDARNSQQSNNDNLN